MIAVLNFSPSSSKLCCEVSMRDTVRVMQDDDEDLMPSNHGLCPSCGIDCEREILEGGRLLLAFVCPTHGATKMIDPFRS